MQERWIGAIALFAGSLMMLAVAFYHPQHSRPGHMHGAPPGERHGAQPIESAPPELPRGTLRLTFSSLVHTGALVALCLLTFGVFTAVRIAGGGAPLMWFSFFSFAFGSFASICAATMSGFVTGTAAYTAMAQGGGEASATLIAQLPVWINQAFGFQHVGFASLASLVWGVAAPTRGPLGLLTQVAGGAAAAVGFLSLATVVAQGARLTTHEFAAFTVVQAVWACALAMLLASNRSHQDPSA